MFRYFIAFLVASGLPILQVNHFCSLAFMEYLCENNFSPANIHNYLAGIRAQFIVYNPDTSPLPASAATVFSQIKINRPLQPKAHTFVDIDLLTFLISLCDAFQDALVYKTLLLVAYFSFLRLSNLLPHTVGSFDPTRQLARGDILFSNEGVTLLIKWSKTLQSRSDIRTIPLPWLKNTPLCPVTSLQTLLQKQSGSSDQPVFWISRCHGLVPLNDFVTRKFLTRLLHILHFLPKLTFHDFRCSGSTWAFYHGDPLH